MNHILHIDASGRGKPSVSRALSNEIVQKISGKKTRVTYRDVSQGLPFVDEQMINAYYTQKAERSEEQHQAVALSDSIVEELIAADAIVIGLPIYNFSMPAGFKTWSDLAARVGETFKYTEKGPIGLLNGKKAYVAVTSGGTKVGSEIDFLTPWLRHFLSFIGINNVEIIQAEAINRAGDKAIEEARMSIALLQ
ncbi:MAG: FMN-dependent NADH-azoreductase [SAR86 cluster bacterium]|uniref:FMN dependent NADH:quinone oxidoreductase n=1 Tax=SAR86 cluster bacterium TaxID=2030880 RepID=A0A2A5AVT8_9GAMM|nr:MAG: FMN-dependent NADH-azoreductase [SAR86 cluster bacterium]